MQSFNSAFMNPPYSNPKPFIEKAWEDSKYCKIVCLVKCDPSTKWWATFWEYNRNLCFKCAPQHIQHKVNRTFDKCDSCRNISNLWLPAYNGPKLGCSVRFFPKRIKFDPPIEGEYCSCDGVHGLCYSGGERVCKSCRKSLKSGPTFPSALIIMDRRNIND